MAIELVTTDGVFAVDGGEWEVTNNIWLVGDDREVPIFDAAHDYEPIAAAVAGRRVAAIVCTHGHNDTVVRTGHGDNTTIGDETERVLDRMSELGLA